MEVKVSCLWPTAHSNLPAFITFLNSHFVLNMATGFFQPKTTDLYCGLNNQLPSYHDPNIGSASTNAVHHEDQASPRSAYQQPPQWLPMSERPLCERAKYSLRQPCNNWHGLRRLKRPLQSTRRIQPRWNPRNDTMPRTQKISLLPAVRITRSTTAWI